MNRIDYCKSIINSGDYTSLLTKYFDETMSLYNIGCTARHVSGSVTNNNPVFELSFNNEDDCKQAEDILKDNSLNIYGRVLLFDLDKNKKFKLTIAFK